MCDQTEVLYPEGDVVWAKIGPIWWPGQVVDLEKTDEGKTILENIKKKPFAVVKFFEEDKYEYIKTIDNIYHYTCRRKDDFIKKGLDKWRTGAPYFAKFATDVQQAEKLTNGNINIINDPKFQPEKKPYAEIFGTPIKRKSSLGSHGHGHGRSKGLLYSLQKKSAKKGLAEFKGQGAFSCYLCRFKANKLCTIVSHARYFHSERTKVEWGSGFVTKPAKRKSPSSKPKKQRIKYKKSLEVFKSPKPTPVTDESTSPKKQVAEELLADWSDEDKENAVKDGEETRTIENEEKKEETSDEKAKEDKSEDLSKSCFDFEEEEDGFIGMSNANTYGRKIPRVLPPKDKSELGVDPEVEELFKRKPTRFVESDDDKEVADKKEKRKNKDLTGNKLKKIKIDKTGEKSKKRKKTKDEKTEKPAGQTQTSKKERRSIAKKTCTEEPVIEPIEFTLEEPPKRIEKEFSGSRRKQDLSIRVMSDPISEEKTTLNVIEEEIKKKEIKEAKSRRSKSRDDDLAKQVDKSLAETTTEPDPDSKNLDNSVTGTKSTETIEDKNNDDLAMQVDNLLAETIPVPVSQDLSLTIAEKSLGSPDTTINLPTSKSKQIIIHKSPGSSQITVLPVVRNQGKESCVVLQTGKKLNLKKMKPESQDITKEETIQSLPAKIKNQTYVQLKGGKLVQLTTPTGSGHKPSTQNKVVIVKKVDQKTNKEGGLPSKETKPQPVYKISDGKGGMRKIAMTASSKKVYLDSSGKYIGTSTSRGSLGNGITMIDNYKGTGKRVVVLPPDLTKSNNPQTLPKRPKILLRKEGSSSKLLMKTVTKEIRKSEVQSEPVMSSVPATQFLTIPPDSEVTPTSTDANSTIVLLTVDEHGNYITADNSSIVDYYVTPQPSDILAEALANTNLLDGSDTIPLMPPVIPSSLVQETSVTLQKPIMTPLEIPSSVAPDTSGLRPPPLPPTPTEEILLASDNQEVSESYSDYVTNQDTYQFQEGEQTIVYTGQPGDGDTYYQMEQVEYDPQQTQVVEETINYEQAVVSDQYIVEDSQESQNYQNMPILIENEQPDTSEDVPISDQDFVLSSSRVQQQTDLEQAIPLLVQDLMHQQRRFREETEVTSTTDEYEKEE